MAGSASVSAMSIGSSHTFCYNIPHTADRLLMCSDGKALTALQFDDTGDGHQILAADGDCPLSLFGDVCRWLDSYFVGEKPAFDIPLSLQGSDFQLRVWRELLTIPYGHTVTYGELARRIGCRSAQAVGGAVSRNPVVIIVPCHRVVGADGSMTGYAYGLNRKRYLLQLESRQATR